MAASTQNQALSAIVFLYKHILKMPLENLDRLKRAKKSSHMPVGLTEQNFLVASGGDIKGILYMENLAKALRESGVETSIRHVMETDVRSLNVHEPLVNVYKILRRGSKNFFPLLDNGEIVGVLDMNNINEFLTFRAARGY